MVRTTDSIITPGNPHPMLLYAGSGCLGLAQKIAEYVDQPLAPCDTRPHPNGESMVRLLQKQVYNVRSRDVFVIQSVCRQFEPTSDQPYTGINDMAMELFVWGNLLSLASAHTKVAVIPHFGYARQDRKNESRAPITARLMVDLIQAAGFNRVLTMDLHAPQIQGFFDPKQCILDHLSAGPVIVEYFKSLDLKNPVILCPDLGNVKKANKYRSGLPNVEMVIIDKTRDPISGKITNVNLLGDVRDKDVFLVDDILGTGGTMGEAMRLASEHGAKSFWPVAVHGELMGETAIKNMSHPKVKQVAVTNTIPPSEKAMSVLNMKILGVEELFGEAMIRIHRGESISELLGNFD